MSEDALWVNLFIGNTTVVDIDGKEVKLHQETSYPWEGKVNLTVSVEDDFIKQT